MRIDHVIYGAGDLDAAAALVEAALGLTAVSGGRHDGQGTHNRIVPLGDGSYLELLAVFDPDEARASEIGRAVHATIARGDGLLGWAVAVDDVDEVAARVGTPVVTVGRQGRTARVCAVIESLAEPCLPFFIERSPGEVSPPRIDWLEVAGDPARLEHWLGRVELPVRVVDGEPEVRALAVAGRELRSSGG